ncbi:hypothetical protein CBM2589_A90553 [Cupriavidus taiwanensis]|uniref:Uncharacterized protein n=1 Tax=Cupriavidus taiwanensis TaxID=164546 RepID=A0A976A988_9BURK|nr:hypothetical protein CBM2589_A90553 [Cupriavidus taiwanensis]
MYGRACRPLTHVWTWITCLLPRVLWFIRIMLYPPGLTSPECGRIGAVKICKKDGTSLQRAAAIMHDNMARGPAAVHAQANAPIKNQGIH